MAHSKSAKKRIKQNEKRRLRNKAAKSRMRTQTKKVLKMMQRGEKPEIVTKEFQIAISLFDKTAKKGIIHTGQSDRRKSRLQKKFNQFISQAH